MCSRTILIGLGANLNSYFGTPKQTLEAVVENFAANEIQLVASSAWFGSTPVPKSDQPDFVNGVVQVKTALNAHDLLARLHEIEATFGRQRRAVNEARCVDLDLLAYGAQVSDGSDGGPVLPHPRMHQRLFVLVPLAQILPEWRHPKLGKSAQALLTELDRTAAAIWQLPD
ncbi:MAG TPA: 2-amino-4-hydroxy-6-hydroxymethyldihydropteridine diphosphokinase [Alphaproteobacteria bacterium]|nr:2-amino-4-hydroxy-6-hydroxymethyldihydropteridine diphosphokinase [Alphaproteobacteria bacterium]HBA43477.1 2-amino-4-hydroxy-6-hydroxymethyldihydropteridine diphosphokinase [Alphaproteobacteria bacterium]